MGFDLSDIGDAFKDAGNFVVNGVESIINASVDAPKAVWVGVQDLGNILAAPFKGPGGFVGLLVGGGVFIIECASGVGIVAGVEGAFGAAAVAGAITNALIKSQPLTQYEYDFACAVFGDNTLPDRENIIKTNMYGIGGRPFTVQNAAGQIIMNLGGGYYDPTNYIRPGKQENPGQNFIHEMTHAWQIQNDQMVDFVCDGLENQIRYTLLNDKSVYNPSGGGKQWSEYNLEQQATLIDMWYMDGCFFHHPFFRYVQGNIRQADPNVGTVDPYQGNWRFCKNCKGLFFAGNGKGVCPASPNGHDGSGSWNYRLPLPKARLNGIAGWRWCHKCQGLFHQEGGNSVCPADKPVGIASKLLAAERDLGLVFKGKPGNPYGAVSAPAGKPMAPALAGLSRISASRLVVPDQRIVTASKPGASNLSKEILMPSASASNHSKEILMPSAASTGHSGSRSAHYRVPGLNFPGRLPPGFFQDSTCGGQTGWNMCQKCQGLYFDGDGPGVCPAGDPHQPDPVGRNSPLYNTASFNGTKWGFVAGGA